MFASRRSYNFSDFAADLRLALLAIFSTVTFFTAAVSANQIVIKEELKTAQGETAEVTIEIPQTEADTQAVIEDALAAARHADATLVESDVTPEAAANALLQAGADPTNAYNASMFVQRTVPYPNADIPQQETVLTPKDRIRGAIFALVKTGISSYVYLGIGHMPIKPAMIAITTSLVLNLAFDTTHVWSKMMSPIKWGVKKLAHAFGLKPSTPRQTRVLDLGVKMTATFILSSLFQGVYAGELLFSDFQKMFFTLKTTLNILASTVGSMGLSQPWEIAFDNMIESGKSRYSPAQIRMFSSIRSVVGAALSAFSQSGDLWAKGASAGVFVTGVFIFVRSFRTAEKIGEMTEAAVKRTQEMIWNIYRKQFCVKVLSMPMPEASRKSAYDDNAA